jgi:hypothetical protein
MAAWGIVNLIREFFEWFAVLLPFKAHSSATLLSLGAKAAGALFAANPLPC